MMMASLPLPEAASTSRRGAFRIRLKLGCSVITGENPFNLKAQLSKRGCKHLGLGNTGNA
jgi:hypothetical protein